MYACCNTLLIGICAIKFCFTTSPFSQNGLFTLENTDALDNLIWIKFLRKDEIEKRTGGERESKKWKERERQKYALLPSPSPSPLYACNTIQVPSTFVAIRIKQ